MSSPVSPHPVVLVASDSADFRRQVGDELESHELRIREGGLDEVTRHLESGDVDLLVLELEAGALPRPEHLDGAVPIVVVTDETESDTGVALLRAGVTDLVSRPFHGPLLAQRILRILGRAEPAVDPLTGVATIVEFRAEVRRAIARAQRSGYCVAVVLLDLKRFRRINEEHGHDVGDRLLREVADRLMRTIRESDTVGRVAGRRFSSRVVSRLGGDRFFIMLEGFQQGTLVAPVIGRLLERLGEPVRVGDGQISLSARAGISLYPTDGTDAAELLRYAESALPGSEATAGAALHFFSTSLARRHQRDLDLENHLRRAIDADSFRLAYQPKISLRTEDLAGFEALLRYEHPTLGPVPAQETIELAERTGLIHSLGEAIFRRVCRDALRLREATGSSCRLFTNFSPRQLESEAWPQSVEAILRETATDPGHVGIEITESVLLSSRPSLIAALQRFSQWGLEISLDDFGTGYSSLSYLTRLPLNEIKIDRSFVADLTCDHPGSREVAGLIVILGRTLDLRVVAEGTETREQLALLSGMGCDLAQGFYYARPRPLETFFDEVLQGRIVPVDGDAC